MRTVTCLLAVDIYVYILLYYCVDWQVNRSLDALAEIANFAPENRVLLGASSRRS